MILNTLTPLNSTMPIPHSETAGTVNKLIPLNRDKEIVPLKRFKRNLQPQSNIRKAMLIVNSCLLLVVITNVG